MKAYVCNKDCVYYHGKADTIETFSTAGRQYLEVRKGSELMLWIETALISLARLELEEE